MSFATPRARVGSYPDTPAGGASARPQRPPPTYQTRQPTPPTRDGKPRSSLPRSSLPPAPENATAAATAGRGPLIPLTIADAPQQRFYACAIYVVMWGFRLYDYLQIQDNGAHAWHFFKWAFLDAIFLFSIPQFRIPWLELSSEFVLVAFCLHVVTDWWLMYNIPLPFGAPLLAMLKVFYDKELAISEHNVKVSSILHNSSLIMGKQIINILPEGSAVLNPDRHPYCLGPDQSTATIPLFFNATVPIEVELTRFDLETNGEETVKLTRREIKEIAKLANKCDVDEGGVVTYKYDYTVKKPGVYRLKKVLDEYKLEVQRLSSPTYIVPCPKAKVRGAESSTRCLGELSDLSLEVEGTPPLKIYYSRTINGKDHSFHFQSLQPEGFSSPLLGSQSSSLILAQDFTWARPQKVPVGLNESMSSAGQWQYSVDEVHDVFGNKVAYQQAEEHDVKPKSKDLFQSFIVRERPLATIAGCDLRNPLKIAKGRSAKLPVKIGRPGKTPDNVPYTLTWQYSPIDSLSKNGDHGDVVEVGSFTTKNVDDQPNISAPGLYTLKSVSSGSCEGEIEEPSSCLLLNPLEPTLSMQSEMIPDKCAGSSIGLRVNLDLVGTPPFNVYYDVISDKGPTRQERVAVKGVRQQIELLPRNAGHYQYRFRRLDDAIYKVSLPASNDYYLEQTVKPPATAFFNHFSESHTACLDQPVKLDVKLLGDAPFTLEWELVHDGRRKTEKQTDITSDTFTIETAPLSAGGDYTVALKSISDRTECKINLKEETKIFVRRQKPRAAFGSIENRRSTTVVEAAQVKIPLKLSGDGPWRVQYRNLNSSAGTQVRVARASNDFIEAKERGTYEIIDVEDNQCPGTVDPKQSRFDVNWFPLPEISLVPTDAIHATDKVHHFVKKEICEGDVDGFEVAFKGSPPYHVEYEVRHKAKVGSGSVARKDLDAVLSKASIQMDTAKAGVYSYSFSALSDNLYNTNKKYATHLTLEQTVNPKPAASFVKPGQTFKSCLAEENQQPIPVKLEGKAPFYLELEIKHQQGTFPEVFRIPNIQTHSVDVRIPRQYLKLGSQQVRIRKVRDDRGCQTETDNGGPVVHFQLYDSPSIYPLEQRTDYCVGDRISYTLSGTPPFEVNYSFGGKKMKAKSQTTNFRRVAESPGEFTITSVSDKASECRAAVNVTRYIHPLPAVRISKGRVIQVDIHEGSEVELVFDFEGTPPFEFTYTRSTNEKKGQKSQIIETRHEVSEDYTKVIMASLEGTYQVVAIKDRHCAYSLLGDQGGSRDKGQKRLEF
ncbi:hypothetical protein GGR57DRAFT_187012 [Xylariaceae sp. FL1272]|nr:hypothetical protein GGR57DRAFT_187012 [Xylariaceae sp. FL1272]